MPKTLITGATGTVGKEVVRALSKQGDEKQTVAAVRNIDEGQRVLAAHPELEFRRFDFEDPKSFPSAFEGIELLFLLRPPHISRVKECFEPLLQAALDQGVEQVVFLSVQGAEKSKVIPHRRIERLIEAFGFASIFVRPAYFMQNLTTTLLPGIQKEQRISLPAGGARFNWVDVRNIGEAVAVLLRSFSEYRNRNFEITGQEKMNFEEVAELMSEATGLRIEYRSMNPFGFYFKKRKEGVPKGLAIVMTILHFLPRIQKEPPITEHYQALTGKAPTRLRGFLERERSLFLAKGEGQE